MNELSELFNADSSRTTGGVLHLDSELLGAHSLAESLEESGHVVLVHVSLGSRELSENGLVSDFGSTDVFLLH